VFTGWLKTLLGQVPDTVGSWPVLLAQASIFQVKPGQVSPGADMPERRFR